jgi:hypothetical protein
MWNPAPFLMLNFLLPFLVVQNHVYMFFFLPSARGRHLSVLVVAGSIAELEQQSWFLLPNISFLLLQC